MPDEHALPSSAARRSRALALLVPIVLLAVAGTVRFYRLDEPGRIYFDEVYYVEDAEQILDEGVESGFAVHPPVGKWVIAAGVEAIGDRPAGWRLGVALAGTLTVLLVYLAGLRLFRRRGIAALAALLLALDGLALTMSRIAMLDMTLALFVVLGAWLLLVDRDRLWADLPEAPEAPDAAGSRLPARPRTYRWLAGLAFGLALATKWSALLAVGAAGLVAIGTELAWRRRVTGHPLRGWLRGAAGIAGSLVLVPAAVYLVTYIPWFANFEDTRQGALHCGETEECIASPTTVLAAWADEQGQILGFHRGLTAEHPYRASPLTWPVMSRPVAYYYEACTPQKLAADECVVEPGEVAEVLGMGNPVLWWAALAAYPVLAWFALVRRDWRAAVLLAFLLGQYLPWLATSRPVFLFYVAPIVPFMALALAYTLWRAREEPALRWLPPVVATLAVAGFLYWYPVLAGLDIPRETWEQRMWFRSWI
jgi:dolichyl-phosphate-mannose-protein mannosyltransferase